MANELTKEDWEVIMKYAKPVFCNAHKCTHYTELPNASKHHVAPFKGHKPLGEAGIMTGVCTREEVGIKDMGKIKQGAALQRVAQCSVYNPGREPAAVNFGALLQSDGTPYGGSIESQSYEYTDGAYI